MAKNDIPPLDLHKLGGKRLQFFREATNVTRKALASRLGISESRLAAVEEGTEPYYEISNYTDIPYNPAHDDGSARFAMMDAMGLFLAEFNQIESGLQLSNLQFERNTAVTEQEGAQGARLSSERAAQLEKVRALDTLIDRALATEGSPKQFLGELIRKTGFGTISEFARQSKIHRQQLGMWLSHEESGRDISDIGLGRLVTFFELMPHDERRPSEVEVIELILRVKPGLNSNAGRAWIYAQTANWEKQDAQKVWRDSSFEEVNGPPLFGRRNGVATLSLEALKELPPDARVSHILRFFIERTGLTQKEIAEIGQFPVSYIEHALREENVFSLSDTRNKFFLPNISKWTKLFVSQELPERLRLPYEYIEIFVTSLISDLDALGGKNWLKGQPLHDLKFSVIDDAKEIAERIRNIGLNLEEFGTALGMASGERAVALWLNQDIRQARQVMVDEYGAGIKRELQLDNAEFALFEKCIKASNEALLKRKNELRQAMQQEAIDGARNAINGVEVEITHADGPNIPSTPKAKPLKRRTLPGLQ